MNAFYASVNIDVFFVSTSPGQGDDSGKIHVRVVLFIGGRERSRQITIQELAE